MPSEIDTENVTIAPCEGANETALISVVPSEIDNENVTIAPCEGANETALISVVPSEIDNENVTIAPCEGKKPMSLLTDSNCEELAHPYLFPTGKFGYKVQRSINLTPNKYFNQRLLNYKQRFASEADYIFFAHSVYQQMNMTSRINIAMQKVKTNKLTAGMLSHNFNDTVKSFVANDEAYSFMSTIKGTPAYWKKFLFEVLAMVKQLGSPTYFMTLSCADLRWNELPSIISKLNGLSLSDEEIREMDYFTRCGLLNSNPVLMARHFQYRVEMFFKEIVIDGPLGKVTYHAIRVEFRVRGSPHIFMWVIGAPILTKETKEEYIRFVDQVIKACLPDVNDDPELFNLVTTYQVHSHSKPCRKYKNKPCRYSFGKFFTDHTIVSEPLPDELSQQERNDILQQRESVLSKVKEYIDLNLNPKKVNILNPGKENYIEPKGISEILAELEIPEQKYYHALAISTDTDFQIHLKRFPNSCFVNNYFVDGLRAWEANLDIQPVFNHYKAVSYMCVYFSKSEDESSEAMKQAAREAKKVNHNSYEQMKAISRAYIIKRECSVQEAVYLIMPELWLRKSYPRVIFANSNLPGNRFRICLSEEEINELPSESTDIFKRNMLDRYLDRPDSTFKNSKFQILDQFCFADFLAHYYIVPGKNLESENDNQPEIFQEIIIEENHSPCGYPSSIPLMSSNKEKLKCRKVRAVLRYHVPNRHKKPEQYAHHLLFMFFPFRNESELCNTPSGTYMEKLNEPQVLAIVNENKQKFEPFADVVDLALSNFHADLSHNQDSYAQQENDEVDNLLHATSTLLDEESPEDDVVLFHDESGSIPKNDLTFLSDDEINQNIRSLNTKQRMIYEIVNKWAVNHTKNLRTLCPSAVKPIYLFITGNGGCGKSHLAKTLCHFLTKTLAYHSGEPLKPRVLILAPTGVAAINVNGNTIHSGLGIPVGNFRKSIPKLNDKKRSTLRRQLSEVKVIVIDEISMVSNYLLLHIHQRLKEIFGTLEDTPFSGISILAFGDFYQLPPINARPVYGEYKDPLLNIAPLWRLFKMGELTEVMRQKGDIVFIDLLNAVRVGKITHDDETLLQSKFIMKNDSNYPTDAIHIWAENDPVLKHNTAMLSNIEFPLYTLNAIDILPKNVKSSLIEKALDRSQMQTGGLARTLLLKVNARVMLTCNIDIPEKLTNGQIGTVFDIKVDKEQAVSMVYIKFDDETAGRQQMDSDNFSKRNRVVPIQKVETNINIHTNKPFSPVIKRTQFPLMLAWGCTVHKVQGKQFSNAVISFKLNRQRCFNYGQIYVALSRVTSLNGLFLVDDYKPSAIRADPKATMEYEILRKEYPIEPIEDCAPLSESSLTIYYFTKH